jgi:hypothetical protein
MSSSRSAGPGQESQVVQLILKGIKEMDEEINKEMTNSDDDDEDDNEGVKLNEFKERLRKRKKVLEDLANQYIEDSKRRKPTITVEKKVTLVADLPPGNTLVLDKQISLTNCLRDVIFKGLKYVTKEVIESGRIVNMVMDNLQMKTEWQRRTYQLHVEIALKKKIGEFRNNSIKNIKWKYRSDQGKGEGKMIIVLTLFLGC